MLMSSFLKFKKISDLVDGCICNFETSPFITNIKNDLIHLNTSEYYLQVLESDSDVGGGFHLTGITQSGKPVDMEVDFTMDAGQIVFEFNISDEYNEPIHLILNDTHVSNPFICNTDKQCYTSFVAYKNSMVLCGKTEYFYKTIRLRLAEVDTIDADEFESYYEITTGNTRSSKAKSKTYTKWELLGTKTIYNAFKQAYNSSKLFFNNIRQSKVEAFNRGQRVKDSNWSVTEFKTNPLEEELILVQQISHTFQIGIGDCDISPSSMDTVYAANPYYLQSGDVIYEDVSMTIPYSGIDEVYMAKINGLIMPYAYTIASGSIVKIKEC